MSVQSSIVNVASAEAKTGSALTRLLRRHPISGYFVLAYAGTWTLLLPAVLSRDGLGALPYSLPFALFAILFILSGLAGPTLAAFVMTGVTSGRPGVRALLRRYVLWRVGLRWYLAVLFGYIALYLLIAVIALGPGSIHSLTSKWPLIFASYLPALLTFNLVTAIGEEPGWRGYALPRLQERYGPLPASLILGTLHAGWHLPVFLLPAIGAGSLSLSFVVTWLPTIWGTTVLWTWIFNNTKRSILIAVLLHSAFDAAGSFVFGQIVIAKTLSSTAGHQVDITQTIVFVALGVLVLALTRGRLSYKPGLGLPPVSAPTVDPQAISQPASRLAS
jgi:membrane protease YdiL (CAAX protease family)